MSVERLAFARATGARFAVARFVVARVAILFAMLACRAAQAETLSMSAERLTLSATSGDVLVRDLAVKGATTWTTQVLPLSTLNGAQQDINALTFDNVTTNGIGAVRLTINLDDTDSGAYRSEIQIRDTAGNVARVPIEVSVRAGWVLPLVMLVLGAGIGYATSYYRAYRLERDELVERIGVTRERLHTVVVDVFREETEKNLGIANDAVRDKNWNKARTVLDANDAMLLRYREHATDWKHVVDYACELEDLVDHTQAKGMECYGHSLRDSITAIRRGAVHATAPRVVTAGLKAFPLRVRRYLELDAILDDGFPDVGEWRRKVNKLAVDDDAVFDEIFDQIRAAIPEGATLDVGSERVRAMPYTTDAEIVAGKDAAKRRDIVFYSGLLVGFVALAAGGFNQLYLQNATFGGVWDYVTIGLWGLGSAAVPTLVAPGSSKR